jgi:hypothetical protein
LRGAAFAVLGWIVCSLVAFWLWIPFVVSAVIGGWVTAAVLVWLCARGAGAPRGAVRYASVVGGVLLASFAVTGAGAIGYIARQFAHELEVPITDVLSAVGGCDCLPWVAEYLAPYLAFAAILAMAASIIGLFQTLTFVRRREANLRKARDRIGRLQQLLAVIVGDLDPVDRDALLAQAATVHSVGPDGRRVTFAVDRSLAATAIDDNPLPVSAEVFDDDARTTPTGVLLVWLDGGYLAGLEFVSTDGRTHEGLPPLSRIAVRAADSW